MKDETILKVSKLGAGCFLALLHVVTGVNGVFLLLVAFLFGLPIEQVLKSKTKE